jgi:hypothetical protein
MVGESSGESPAAFGRSIVASWLAEADSRGDGHDSSLTAKANASAADHTMPRAMSSTRFGSRRVVRDWQRCRRTSLRLCRRRSSTEGR